MSEVTLQDIAIAIARMETKQDAMMKQLEELTKTTDQHWKKIGELETKLALLEQRQGPRVHWTAWVGPILGIVALIAAYVTYIVK
jgi:septal ring factor EnvC (AmiA/AmiB activator)